MVEFGMEPCHRERARGAAAAAHAGAAIRVFCEGDPAFLRRPRQDFGLDELRVLAGDGVVFEAALADFAVAAAGVE